MTTKEIPFSQPFIGKEEIEEVTGVLKGKWITTGEKVKEFENNVKDFLGVNMAVAVSSGTAALDISLSVNNVCDKDEVITTPYTFVSTVLSIIHRGAHPVLIDIEAETFNIDINKILEYINTNYIKTSKGLRSKTRKKYLKGIIAVHFAGQSADLDELNKIAEENELFLIEDAAHAIGAKYKGIKIGNSKNAVCFSFYSNKNITTGEGGMIVKQSNKDEDIYRKLSLHGISKNNVERYKTGLPFYDVEYAGYKNNLTDIQAAIGVAQMKKIEHITKRRNLIAKWYDGFLQNLSFIDIPKIKSHNYSARHLYPILIKPELKEKRDSILIYLRKNKIFPSVHFVPIHFFSFFKKYYSKKETENLKISEDMFFREISLPVFPELTKTKVELIVKTLKKYNN